MRYIVTGAAGFIGSHLVDELLDRGHEVVGIDDLSNGLLENIRPALFDQRFTFLKQDVKGFKWHLDGVDGVFHLAAIGSVPRSWSMPTIYHENNTTPLVELLAAIDRITDGKKPIVVFASSSSVYGNSNAPNKSETDPLNPRSPYAASKAACENYARAFATRGGEISAVRFFNIFGPRQRHDIAAPAFIPAVVSALLTGKRPVIYGPDIERDFTPVSMVVDALISEMERVRLPRGELSILNVGRGQPITLLELSSRILSILNMLDLVAETEVLTAFDITTPRVGDILKSKAAIERIKPLLGERFNDYNENQFNGELWATINTISTRL